MSDHSTDDRDLIKQFRAGSESAAGELFDRYCEKLMRLARAASVSEWPAASIPRT